MGFLLLSQGCIPRLHDFAFVSGFAFHSRSSAPHNFACVSRLSATLVSRSGCSGPHAFTFVSHLFSTLRSLLWPHDFARVSHSGCSGPHDFTLVSHSGRSGPHEFTLESHLPPTLVSHSGRSGPHAVTFVSHSGWSGPHELTLVSHLPPTLVSRSGRSWAACFYICLPLVSHTCLPLWVLWAA